MRWPFGARPHSRVIWVVTPLSSRKISFSGAISRICSRNCLRRSRLATVSRSRAWSDFFYASCPGCEAVGQPDSCTPPHQSPPIAGVILLRSDQAARSATCAAFPGPLLRCGSAARDAAELTVAYYLSVAAARGSSCYSPNLLGTGRPTREGYLHPPHRLPEASNANHPNRVMPSVALRGDRRFQYPPDSPNGI